MRTLVVQGDRKAIAKASAGTFASVIFGAVVAFALTLFVSNTLSNAGTGSFFQIMAFVAIMSTACTFGADTGLVKSISAKVALGHQSTIKTTITVAMVPVTALSCAMALAIWCAAPSLGNLFSDPQAVGLIRLLAVFIIPGSLMNVLFGGIRGFGRIGAFTVLQNVLLPCLRFAAVAAVVFLGWGTIALGAAWVFPLAALGCAAAYVLTQSYLNAQTKTPPSSGPSHTRNEQDPSALVQARNFWSFSSGRGASALLEIVLEWIDVILVGLILGPAAAGVYGVVNRCVRMGQMADHSARIVAGPMLGAAMAVRDLPRAQIIYLVSTRLLVLVAWPFYLTLIIAGRTLLTFFGPDFVQGYQALVIISIAMCLAVSAGGVQSVLLMAGRSRWQLYNKLASLAVAVTGNLLLIPLWGIKGAATTWAAAVLVDCTLATWEVHHFLRIRVSLRSLAVPMGLALGLYGAGLVATQAVFGASLSVVALALLTISGIYLATAWRLRTTLGFGRHHREISAAPVS